MFQGEYWRERQGGATRGNAKPDTIHYGNDVVGTAFDVRPQDKLGSSNWNLSVRVLVYSNKRSKLQRTRYGPTPHHFMQFPTARAV